jgi:deferrochelatase/peroxidase EfeB
MTQLLRPTEIQGNIYRPFARDHSVYLFLRFAEEGPAARRAMREILRPRVISAAEQADLATQWNQSAGADANVGRTVGALGLTSAGYRQLQLEAFAPADPDLGSVAFDGGSDSVRYPGWNPEKKEWEAGYKSDIHAFLLLCDHSWDRLQVTAQEVLTEFSRVGAIVQQECGHRITAEGGDRPGSLEPFGFRDDKSHGADPDLVLADHRPGSNPAGAAIGCYATFLKVEQNVSRFQDLTNELAGRLKVSTERAQELAVGRRKNGDVVEGVTPCPNDDFKFLGLPESVCPYQAHVRLMNRRDGVDKNRLIRRGIPYGSPAGSGPRGLLFLSLQRKIADFGLLMTRARVGMDPLLSRSSDWTWPSTETPGNGLWDSAGRLGQRWPSDSGDVSFPMNDVAAVRGAVYFFIPPLALLEMA